jgi:diketogulonate reductase-like aldo/keto reductase
LGRSRSPPVALGTLNLSPENAAETIKAATPTNILIDTAEIYANGKAEAMVQSACRQAGRVLGETAFCATKFAPRSFGSAKSVVTACRESASRLAVESIDLYQIHNADSLVQLVSMGLCKPQDEAHWDGLAECYHQGLASNVCVYAIMDPQWCGVPTRHSKNAECL